MSDFPILRPTKIFDYKGRRISANNQFRTPVHYHSGTAYDGAGTATINWTLNIINEWSLDYPNPNGRPANILNINPTYPSDSFVALPSEVEGVTTGRYGIPGTLIKPPRMIRVIHGGGYYDWEHYPGISLRNSLRVPESSIPGTQSVYVGDVGDGSKEPTIDYIKDLSVALVNYCESNGIMLRQMFYPFINTYENPDHSKQALFGNPQAQANATVANLTADNVSHMGRWMYHLGARYWLPASNNTPAWDDSQLSIVAGDEGRGIIDPYIPVDQIVGGEVLNIVFVTDAYGAYHGLSYDPLGIRHFHENMFSVGSHDLMNQDLARIKQQFPRFKKWGLVIVNSPKNAEFFPAWFVNQFYGNGDTNGNPLNYCLKDAQDHFRSVAEKLKNYNTKLLMRDVSFGAVPAGHEEASHLTFGEPQVTINEIMSAVRDFWG